MLIDAMWGDFVAPDGSFDASQVSEDINHLVNNSKEIKKLRISRLRMRLSEGKRPLI